MKKLMSLALMMLSFSVLARETVTLTHFGNSGSNRAYYACSYAESQAETFLTVFGATDIDVRCSGGIQSWGMHQPVVLHASFELPTIVLNSVETISVKGDTWNPACGLNVQMINAFLKKFSNIEVAKKSDGCAFTSSNYYYLLNITR